MKNRKEQPSLSKKFHVLKKARSPYINAVKIKTENNGLGLLKAIVIFGIIILQMLMFIFLHFVFMLSYQWTIIITFFISLITCIYVLSSNKNSQSKAVWIIFLLIFFPFAYMFYLLSDERLLMSGAGKRYKKIYNDTSQYQKAQENINKQKNISNECAYLYRAGGFRAYMHTESKYFSSGTTFFDDLIERLKSAEYFIFMEFFIVADGVLLNRILDVLAEKVKNGVKVRLIYDDMGSHKVFSRNMKKTIKKLGIELLAFNKIFPIFSLAINYRDHRKIIIVDGKTAYTGGCNLADEYINEKRIHGYWKDAGIKIDGEGVDGLTITFLRQWEFLTKEKEDYSKFLMQADSFNNESVIVPYADGLDYSIAIGKNVYENMISNAIERIYIMTPYFIVDDTLTNLLITKAMSGVDVRLIIPEVPDKAFVYGVTRNNAEKLIDYGVKVYCMKNSFVHSKVLLTDNSAVVGSINMDLRSFYQQFECAIYLDDKSTLEDISKDFNDTINQSFLITEKKKLRKHFIYRMFAGVMQIFAPFM